MLRVRTRRAKSCDLWLPTAGVIQASGIRPCHINIAAGVNANTYVLEYSR